MHNLGSREWHDRNWQAVVTLGEDLDADHAWDNGEPPAVRPLPIVVGSAACVRDGDRYADRSTYQINGFVQGCYGGSGPDNPLWFEASAIERCGVQRFYATILFWMGYEERQLPADAFFAFLGPACVLTYHAATDIFPDFYTLIHPEFSVLVSYGTRTSFQLATQAFTSIRRPDNLGRYGSLRLWNDAATHLHDGLVADGANPDKPILLVGYSYGAAACANLALRYQFGRPDRVIRLLTYGMPKPGDFRMQTLLRDFYSIHFANDDDPVPVIPPDPTTYLPVMVALNIPQMEVYSDWRRPPDQWALDLIGRVRVNDAQQLDFTQLSTFMLRILAGFGLVAPFAHYMDAYKERLDRRCSEAEWPIDQEVVDILETTVQQIVFTHAIVPARYALGVAGDGQAFNAPALLLSSAHAASNSRARLQTVQGGPAAQARVRLAATSIADERLRLVAPGLSSDTFTTAGAHTWTAPAGVAYVRVQCIGSGAGGAPGADGGLGLGSGGQGGGGGEYAEKIVLVTEGNTYDLNVGDWTGATDDERASWFIGDGGDRARGNGGNGPTGGAGGDGTILNSGGNGGSSTVVLVNGSGGGGGGGGGSSGAGGNGQDSTDGIPINPAGGAGGGDPAGDGGAGGASGNNAGANGSAFGGGGGGGGGTNLGMTPGAGGNGSNGWVRLIY